MVAIMSTNASIAAEGISGITSEKVADMVVGPWMFWRETEVTAPIDVPLTVTSAM